MLAPARASHQVWLPAAAGHAAKSSVLLGCSSAMRLVFLAALALGAEVQDEHFDFDMAIKGKAGQAKQFGGMFGGMASKMFGSSDDTAAATSGFTPSQPDADSGPSWPGSGGAGAVSRKQRRTLRSVGRSIVRHLSTCASMPINVEDFAEQPGW